MALVTRRTLASFLSRTLATRTASPIASPIRSRFAFAALENHKFAPESIKTLIRSKSSGSGYSPLNDPSPNWSNRPPKETILLDGCDYEHWLIVMEFTSDAKPSEDEMVSAYVKTLASVVGSEEEAKRKIYSVCTTTYTGFGALISEELSNKVKGLPGVLWVLPDSYLDVPNKDYGGDLFVDGKVIHRPQFRFDQRQQTRSRPRPRYDRRRETMQVERREPIQRDSWAQQDREPMSQSTRMTCPKDLDPAWKYGDMINTKRQKSRCKFCGHENQSGGVMRLKQHLAGGFKNVKNCPNCPQAVREEMQIRIHGKLVE